MPEIADKGVTYNVVSGRIIFYYKSGTYLICIQLEEGQGHGLGQGQGQGHGHGLGQGQGQGHGHGQGQYSNIMNLYKRLNKNNAISLICYDIIPSDVWQVFTKWRNKQGIKVNVAQFTHWKRRVYQIEFTGNVSLLEDDLYKIDPRFLKKLSIIKRVVRRVKRQKNLWMPWIKTKTSNIKDDIADLFCYYVKAPIIRVFKRLSG